MGSNSPHFDGRAPLSEVAIQPLECWSSLFAKLEEKRAHKWKLKLVLENLAVEHMALTT